MTHGLQNSQKGMKKVSWRVAQGVISMFVQSPSLLFVSVILFTGHSFLLSAICFDPISFTVVESQTYIPDKHIPTEFELGLEPPSHLKGRLYPFPNTPDL